MSFITSFYANLLPYYCRVTSLRNKEKQQKKKKQNTYVRWKICTVTNKMPVICTIRQNVNEREYLGRRLTNLIVRIYIFFYFYFYFFINGKVLVEFK